MSRKRSKWSQAKGRETSFSGQFAGRLIEMLELPAYRVLSLAAHRMLDRLDVELGHHGGTENGNLIVTYRQFEAYGIHKDSVGPAQRELEALGFIEITERGCAGNAGFGKPNKFRLTFHPAEGAPSDGSHEWRRFKTIEDAERAKEEARETPPQNSANRGGRRVRKQKPTPGFQQNSPPETLGGPPPETMGEKPGNPSKCPIPETMGTIYISPLPSTAAPATHRRSRRRSQA